MYDREAPAKQPDTLTHDEWRYVEGTSGGDEAVTLMAEDGHYYLANRADILKNFREAKIPADGRCDRRRPNISSSESV
jgi:hypothetical protein